MTAAQAVSHRKLNWGIKIATPKRAKPCSRTKTIPITSNPRQWSTVIELRYQNSRCQLLVVSNYKPTNGSTSVGPLVYVLIGLLLPHLPSTIALHQLHLPNNKHKLYPHPKRHVNQPMHHFVNLQFPKSGSTNHLASTFNHPWNLTPHPHCNFSSSVTTPMATISHCITFSCDPERHWSSKATLVNLI